MCENFEPVARESFFFSDNDPDEQGHGSTKNSGNDEGLPEGICKDGYDRRNE